MNGNDIHRHFEPMRAWLPPEKTCDGVKVGDAFAEIKGIAVMWKPALDDLRAAAAIGCNFILGHESVFQEGGNGHEEAVAKKAEAPKLEFIRAQGLCCYRCHDGWDLHPVHGVRDAWTTGLGYPLTAPHAAKPYYRAVDLPSQTFDDVCAHVLARLRPLGVAQLVVRGEGRRPVRRLVIGTGAGLHVDTILELGGDACLVSDDYFRSVRDAYLLDEAGIGVIVINHATKEAWGIENLAAHARAAFAPIPVHFFPQHSVYRNFTMP